jgi:hypothetical protein
MLTYIFIKKSPTFQVRFENIFAHQRTPKRLLELSLEERQRVINYCKYRLGIETHLETESDLDRCKAF